MPRDPSRGEDLVAGYVLCSKLSFSDFTQSCVLLTVGDLETGLKARYSHSGNRLGGRDKKMYRGCHLLSCNISRFMALVDIGVVRGLDLFSPPPSLFRFR